MMNGSVPRNTSPMRERETEAVTNSTVPTGGVSRPIMSAMIVITPSVMGSTPYVFAIGTRIGTISTRIAVASITVPSTRHRRTTRMRKTVGLSLIANIASVIICGTRSRARM